LKIIQLREVAHARSGEKGDIVTVAVIAYREEDYQLLQDQVTEGAVRSLYRSVVEGEIKRYEAPGSHALNFVLEGALRGGRSRTLAFDESGKALSSVILRMDIEVPDDFVPRSKDLPDKPISFAPKPGDSRPPSQAASTTTPVRLGAATGWARDRFGPAEDMVTRGELNYICFDSMSEVTMSAAQVAKLEDPAVPGYDPYLEGRLSPIIRGCQENGTKIISNQGWLDPVGAAEKVLDIATDQGLSKIKVAAISGGVLTDRIADMGLRFLENNHAIEGYRDRIVSAETYLGAEQIVEALRNGADVVITTRVADACLYLGPLAYEFGWSFSDWDALAKGMTIGHLMECATQVTGGFFADPGYKDVPDIENLGHPIAEVTEDTVLITKLASTGGLVTTKTCKEQLLYEVADPGSYLAPDVVTDFGGVKFRQVNNDIVEVAGFSGRTKPDHLKVLVGITEGYMAEEMVLFAGPGAMERAALAKRILQARFARINLQVTDIRMDYLGVNGVHREASPEPNEPPYEVILRIAIVTDSESEAQKLRREVDPMAVNGPSATGKWAPMGNRVRPVVGLYSTLVPRDQVPVTITYREL
jgi:hypothetical protein